MTWAARYSRTKQPELTIWRDGEVVDSLSIDDAHEALNWDACLLQHVTSLDDCVNGLYAAWHDVRLRADIAARVPVRECEETQACTNWAMPDGRCHHVHGGSDEL